MFTLQTWIVFRLFGIRGSISVSDGVHELQNQLIRQRAKCIVFLSGGRDQTG